jgi:membrane-associated phospholipid phosphatase
MQEFAPQSRKAALVKSARTTWWVLRHHGLLLGAAAAVCLFGYLVSAYFGYRIDVSLLTFVQRYVVMAGLIVFAGVLFWKTGRLILVERPQSPLREMARWLWQDVFNPARLINGAVGMVVVLLLIAGFSQAKNNAVRIAGYSWDPVWLWLDRTLHFSVLPQDLLSPVLGTPSLTQIIDYNYSLWYAVLFASCFVGAFQASRSLTRHRFMLALIFTIGIGGSLLAIVFSSVGPVYFGEAVAGANPYGAHMALLNDIHAHTPLHALETQKLIWEEKARPGGASLVSAMPSMHVAVAALVAMALWRFGGVPRAVSLVFAVLILLGSVHLGWHYAVDGYAGILIAAGSWWAANPISRWYLRRIGELPPG